MSRAFTIPLPASRGIVSARVAARSIISPRAATATVRAFVTTIAAPGVTFTGQLGTAFSYLGNIELGVL